MLLRLNYLGSANRHSFMSQHAPDLYVLPNRPSFKANGATDSIDYAWFVWDKYNLNRTYGQTTLLDLTSLAIRKAEHERLRSLRLFGVVEAEKEDAAKIVAA